MNMFFCRDEDTQQAMTASDALICHQPLREARVIERGIVVPMVVCENDTKVCCGVIDSDGQLVPESATGYGFNEESLTAMLHPDIPYVDKTVVYLGPLRSEHYGHFLVEAPARLWYWNEHGKTQENVIPLFTYWKGQELPKTWPSYVRDLLTLAGDGLLEKMECLTAPTRYARVIVPMASYGPSFYTDMMMPTYRRIAASIPCGTIEKIYLTRRNFETSIVGGTLGEEEIERHFALNGFTIISPEKLSLREQISLMKGAHIIAGLSGTAMHNILFSEHLKQVIVLERSKLQGTLWQFVINKASGADCYVCDAYENLLPMPEDSYGPFLLGMTPRVCELFHTLGMQIRDAGIPLKKYLKRYLQDYRALLETRHYAANLMESKLTFNEMKKFLMMEDFLHTSPLKLLMLRILSLLLPGKLGKRAREKRRILRNIRKKCITEGYIYHENPHNRNNIRAANKDIRVHTYCRRSEHGRPPHGQQLHRAR